MYYYAYAAFTNTAEQIPLLGNVKAAINAAHITGAEGTLSEWRSLADLVADARLQKATTFVLVGDDQMFHAALPTLLAHNEFAVGFLPFAAEAGTSVIATTLGMPMLADAARVLARRRIVRVPVGLANETPFLTAVTLRSPLPPAERRGLARFRRSGDTPKNVTVRVNEKTALTARVANMSVHNLPVASLRSPTNPTTLQSPRGRHFTIVLEEAATHRKQPEHPRSVLTGKSVRIEKLESGAFLADGAPLGPGPFDLTFARRSLKLIVGPTRTF